MLLFEEEYNNKQTGIKAVYQVFVDEMKMKRYKVKAMIMNHPPLLSKSTTDLRLFFEMHRNFGFTD